MPRGLPSSLGDIEQRLAAAAVQRGIEALARFGRQRLVVAPQPGQALALVGKGLLHPGLAVDGGLQFGLAAFQRPRIGQQQRCVQPPRLAQKLVQACRQMAHVEPVAIGRHQADTGTVVVALSIMPHVGLLPIALREFRQRYPRVRLHVIEGLFPDVERGLREGAIDFYIGAAPRAAPGLAQRHVQTNTRVVICRQGHPLGASRSLKALKDADWAVTAVDYDVDEDLARLFGSHGLAPPMVLFRARSAMSILVALAHSDLLAMLPVQWAEFPLTRDVLQVVRVREHLPAPDIVLIRRPDLPLTPAAEYLCDVMLRHVDGSLAVKKRASS